MYETQKAITWSSIRTGVVVSTALFIFLLTIFFSGNIFSAFTPKYSVYVIMSNVQGLRSGAPVWLYGFEIGSVKDITIQNQKAYVQIQFNKKYAATIHSNAEAVIMTMGILGDKFIEINPGTPENPLISSGDTISGKSAIEFDQIMAITSSVLTQLDSSLSQLSIFISSISNKEGSFGKLITDPHLYDQLTVTVKSLNNFTNELTNSKGSFSKLLNDTSLYANLNEASEELTYLISKIDHGLQNGGIASDLINNDTLATDIHQSINSLKAAANSVKNLFNDIQNNPKKYLNFKLF